MIRDELINISDKEYAEFNSKLCPDTNKKMLGVRIPKLRKLAQTLVKEYSLDELLKLIKEEYFEEVLLKGLVIGYSKIPLEEKLSYIKEYVSKMDSWAMTDTFVPTLKIKEKDLDIAWKFMLPYLKSEKEFEVRFSIIMMLDYYIKDKYVDEVIKALDKVKHEGYYVKMGTAWTLAEIGIKFNKKFMTYFKNNNLDKFTHNKTIQKMCESYRVDEKQKGILRSMKIKM
jgi:3-methyladenine DNA glycosylase AlkD